MSCSGAPMDGDPRAVAEMEAKLRAAAGELGKMMRGLRRVERLMLRMTADYEAERAVAIIEGRVPPSHDVFYEARRRHGGTDE